tara:strand:- start:10 stop:240 length:231 start_codon:yes stop_codon:yes gene_type:complete
MSIHHDAKCLVTCTNNDKSHEGDVGTFLKEDRLDVYIVGAKIAMKWNGKVYVGESFGLEFTTPGPEHWEVSEGRGR